jgi:NAD(P)-dependent dehydrogenase (short-subunit alcohol dehydrogenase family)
VVLITGGGSGIGAATGELVCAEGGNAMLIDANVESLATTTKTIVDQIPDALVATFVADVAQTSGAIRAVECALEEVRSD